MLYCNKKWYICLPIIDYNFSSITWLESVGRKAIFVFHFVFAYPSDSEASSLFCFTTTEPQKDFTVVGIINLYIWKAPMDNSLLSGHL